MKKWSLSLIKTLLAMTLLILTVTLFSSAPAWANNVKVTNVVLNGALVNKSSHTIPIKFDLSQDNAFGDLTDANSQAYSDYIWIFVKYYAGTSYDGTGYRSAKLQATGSDSVFTVTTDGAGAFIKASNAKAGLTLVWNYGTNVDDSDNTAYVTTASTINLKVFAIEMVKIPQGSFYVGDGATTNIEGQLTAGTSSTNPYKITSEGPLTLGGSTGNIGNNNASGMTAGYLDDFNNTTQQSLSDNTSGSGFPKGYKAFYCMKYEITQGQYRDFLNTLSRALPDLVTAAAVGTTILRTDARPTATPPLSRTLVAATITLCGVSGHPHKEGVRGQGSGRIEMRVLK